MAEEAQRREQRLAEFAGVISFFVLLFLADWLVHVTSMVVFRLDPLAVPENFFIAYEADRPDSRGIKYQVVSWGRFASARQAQEIGALILPEPSGRIQSKGDSMSFKVLENDGARQVIEVKYAGAYRSWSRYEAYADRIVPLAYRSYGWDDDRYSRLAWLAAGLVIAGLGACGIAAGARRLLRRFAVRSGA